MHESSMVMSILDSVSKIAHEKNLESVELIKIKVGKLHQIVPDFMINIFNEMRSEYPKLLNANLELNEVAVTISCKICQTVSSIETFPIFLCPKCQSVRTETITGSELFIESIKGNEKET